MVFILSWHSWWLRIAEVRPGLLLGILINICWDWADFEFWYYILAETRYWARSQVGRQSINLTVVMCLLGFFAVKAASACAEGQYLIFALLCKTQQDRQGVGQVAFVAFRVTGPNSVLPWNENLSLDLEKLSFGSPCVGMRVFRY